MAAWEHDVVEELERARREGRALISSFSKTGGCVSSTNGSGTDTSGDNIDNFAELRETSTELSTEASAINPAWQEEQDRLPPPTFDPNTHFKPEELNEKVAQLLSTEIRRCEDDGNDLNDIVQYSV